MAITGIDYLFWKELRDEGALPRDPAVLELGQANWYGDRDPACLADDVRKNAKPEKVELLLDALKTGDPFVQASIFYEAVVQASALFSIDLNGTKLARVHDLNTPFDGLRRTVDIVINSGTAEHVWNQDQFFRTCHECCRPGGLMVHMLPAWGWFDHGFYNYHPTFVRDLAAANGYGIVKWWLYDLDARRVARIAACEGAHGYAKDHGLAGSVMHAVAFRRTSDALFRVPMQGYYAGTLSKELTEAWEVRT